MQLIATEPGEDGRVLALVKLLALDTSFLKVLQVAHSVPLSLEVSCLDHDLGDAFGPLLRISSTFQAALYQFSFQIGRCTAPFRDRCMAAGPV